MRETTIKGVKYRTGKLGAFEQWHIVRRVAPLAPGLVKLFMSKKEGDQLVAFDELANALAKMTNEDSEYVLKTCLGAVERQEAAGWAKIMSARGDLMYPDEIDLGAMMTLVPLVVEDNIAPFFAAFQRAYPDGAPGPQAS